MAFRRALKVRPRIAPPPNADRRRVTAPVTGSQMFYTPSSLRRARPPLLSAWTLMGHEYVELKNTAAAVDAYRHAVVSPERHAHGIAQPSTRHRGRVRLLDQTRRIRRHRYGLGQTYEILQMPYYALFYYRKATGCGRFADVVRGRGQGAAARRRRSSYQVAAALGDPRGLLTSHPIRTPPPPPTASRGEHGSRRHRASGARADLQGGGGHAACGSLLPAHPRAPRRRARRRRRAGGAEALSFLANFCKERGELREASQYCTRLVDSGSQFKEEAKAMLREIHARTTSG